VKQARSLLWTLVSWIANLRRQGFTRTIVVAAERKAFPLYPVAPPEVPIAGAGRRDAHLRRILSYMHTCVSVKQLTPCLACRCLEILNGIDRPIVEDELKRAAFRLPDEIERVRVHVRS
jgi:hypothetical protein